MSDDIKLGVDYSEVDKASKSVDRLGRSAKGASLQQSGLTKTSKKFTMGIQQAGFQVGDFAAQVQNGTSAMVALGQQGPQLLGVFGVFGALAGAALAIGTAIVKASNAGKELSFDFKGLSKDLSKLFEPAKPVFEAIGKAFKAVGKVFMIIINGLIKGTAKFFTILSHLPAIAKEAAGQAGDRFKAFQLRIDIMIAKMTIGINNFIGNFKVGFVKLINSIMKEAVGFGVAYFTIYKTAYENIKTLFAGIADWFAGIFTKAINAVIDKANGMIEKINGMIQYFGGEGLDLIGRIDPSDKDATVREYKNLFDEVAKAYQSSKDSVTGFGLPDTSGTDKSSAKATQGLIKAADALSVLKAELDKPLESVQDLYAALEKVGDFDLGNYFEFVKKAGKETKKALKDVKSDAELARDALAGSMEDAMMSMVDGTKSVKEAFKSMASSVIKELYRIYVVKKITGMVTGALEGSKVPFFGGASANGGPVDGGRSYLVGERGPEIFTPSVGGNITPNSQSGGSGITVVQNINVSTGVQQTVRSEIRSLMPQIAESAKSAVADAKRRGGNYGKAFA